ncbi:Ger(x)C family spore germination protein [Cohnella sp. CFH 77786]|uniref:Ger(x)C family spore germination protein n=1 Tax=Cohnella sp. CFH 77786 TaxID=2662265 RepID=UPI001C60DF5D|nr:Ger(x)C family spore germination protein [Cohnella sp. CFH 77786]MBW5445671.1 Ger(x)C family spore germination protein [Cohnella sp. CFH 77786]
MKGLGTLKRCAVLAISCTLLAGCWDRKEMDDIALVMASAIDQLGDGQIELSLQIALPTGIPGTLQTGGKGQKPVLVVAVKGKNAHELIGQAQQQLSRKLFFGHRGVIIFGEEYARRGITEVLDTLLRFPDSRYNSFFLTARGASAKEILTTPYHLELIPAIGMKIMQNSQYTVGVKIDRFLDHLAADGTMPYSGAIRIVKDAQGEPTFQIDQVAVYRENKLAGYLSGKSLQAFKMIKGMGKGMKLTAEVEPKGPETQGTITADVLSVRSKIRAFYVKGTPSFDLTVNVDSRGLANDSTLDISKTPNLLRAEKALTDELNERLTDLLTLTQREFKSDVVGFGRELHIEHPKAWKKLKKRWTDLYPEVPVRVRARVHLERIGRTQAPGHLELPE